MPRVFLSRELRANSPFQQLQQLEGWQLEAKTLLAFSPVRVSAIPAGDWLFFYSGKGVEMLLAQHQPLPGQKLACLGRGAARKLEANGWTADYTGNGNPLETAQQFGQLLGQQKVVFVQARHSRASVAKILGTNVNKEVLVVYDNQPRRNFSVAPADYLIFTSPLNFIAYQQKYNLRAEQRIIGIGETTAVTFSEKNVKVFRIATHPSEEALLACLLEWEQDYPLTQK